MGGTWGVCAVGAAITSVWGSCSPAATLRVHAYIQPTGAAAGE